MPVFFAVVIAIGILVYFGVRGNRRSREMRENAKRELAGTAVREPTPDLTAPQRPTVASFRIEGNEAIVTFSVPLLAGDVDEVLADLLVAEAVEVLRDEAPGRSIDNVTTVVACAGDDGREVGRRSLEFPGSLPPALGFGHLLQFSKFGLDPIDGQFEGTFTAGTSVGAGSDDLGPIGDMLVLPKAVDLGLRTRGLDPSTMRAGEFVLTLLELFEYDVTSGELPGTYTASKGGRRTYIREEPHTEDGHPELNESVINQFMFDFSSSGADRGLLVTEKWGPYEIYDREKRQPHVRFVTRERLQGFVDALSLG